MIPLADTDLADNVNLHARRRVHVDSDSENDEQDAPRQGRRGSTRVAQSQYYAFQLQNHDGIFSPLLSSTPVVCFKNFVSMPVSVWKLTVSILRGLIRLNYELIATVDYRMQSVQGLRRMRRG